MINRKVKLNIIPTHACPCCGEWFDVQLEGPNQWAVTPHDNEHEMDIQVWAEAAALPLCPFDSETLADFRITD